MVIQNKAEKLSYPILILRMEDEISSRKYIICRYKSQVLVVAVSLFLVAFFSIPVVIFYVYRSPTSTDVLLLAETINTCAQSPQVAKRPVSRSVIGM